MLDVAIRKGGDTPPIIDLGTRAAPPLPIDPALGTLLPDGLRRGSTVTVTGSISLLLALLGPASASGAWCALVGFPHISAEAASEYGIELSRLAIIPAPGEGWTTVVGALLDAVDVVAARPPRRLVPGDVRRLVARARTRDAVLVPFCTGSGGDVRNGGPCGDGRGGIERSDGRGAGNLGDGRGGGSGDWPGADVRLRATPGPWTGIEAGSGRLQARRVDVTADGRGSAARPRSATLWLPTAAGGVATAEQLAPVIELVS
ncbi:MAG: hypothetical protein ACRDWT_19540 [Jatrophihabitantaceae bacterium]